MKGRLLLLFGKVLPSYPIYCAVWPGLQTKGLGLLKPLAVPLELMEMKYCSVGSDLFLRQSLELLGYGAASGAYGDFCDSGTVHREE